MSKLAEAAIERLIAEAEKKYDKAVETSEYAMAIETQSYINGLSVALAVIRGAEKKK